MESQKVAVVLFTAAWCFSSLYDHPIARLSCLGAMLVALPLTHSQVGLPLGCSAPGAVVAVVWAAIFFSVWFVYEDDIAIHAAVFALSLFMLNLGTTKGHSTPARRNVQRRPTSAGSREWLFDFYSQHNPAKATEEHVDSTLQKYSGREDVLVSKLRARYNVQDHAMANEPAEDPPPAARRGTFGGWSTPTVDEAVLECLHEYGEVCLESDKLGQRLEVYLRKRDEYVVKRDSEVLVELATADEVYEYLLTLPQISTFKVL